MFTKGYLSIILLLIMGSILFAGCDFFGKDRPEEAKLTIEGDSPVGLIVSGAFISGRQEIVDPSTGFVIGDSLVVSFFTADTAIVNLPFEQTYDISINEQFYARILRLQPEDGEFTSMLFIDGNVESEHQLLAEQDSVVIVYNFDNRVPEDENVRF